MNNTFKIGDRVEFTRDGLFVSKGTRGVVTELRSTFICGHDVAVLFDGYTERLWCGDPKDPTCPDLRKIDI